MNKISSSCALDFDDVLIVPKIGGPNSRSSVKIENSYGVVPILASNVDTVGTFSMAKVLNKYNCGVFIHKHYSLEKLVDFFSCPKNRSINHYTMGISDKDFVKFYEFVNKVEDLSGIKICIDVANAYIKDFYVYFDKVAKLLDKKTSSDFYITFGNICTPEPIKYIADRIDYNFNVKIGIGSSRKFCKTRDVTGVGYPQLQAVLDCKEYIDKHNLSVAIISDGGCSKPGDVCKALCAGADYVMLGGMLAGCEESEAVEELNGHKFVKSYGMSSHQAMEKYQNIKDYRSSEGKESIIPYRGSVEPILLEILGGLRSMCTYIGVNNISDAFANSAFVLVNRQQ